MFTILLYFWFASWWSKGKTKKYLNYTLDQGFPTFFRHGPLFFFSKWHGPPGRWPSQDFKLEMANYTTCSRNRKLLNLSVTHYWYMTIKIYTAGKVTQRLPCGVIVFRFVCIWLFYWVYISIPLSIVKILWSKHFLVNAAIYILYMCKVIKWINKSFSLIIQKPKTRGKDKATFL